MTGFIDFLPTWNAICNGLASALIIAGYLAIRQKRISAHQRLMTAAVICSALFLAGYLTRHIVAGSTRFQGQGSWRVVYFSILASHTLLAMVSTPLVVTTFILGMRGRFERHRRWAKITLPIWLYVSLTGVVIYFMLYQIFTVTS